MEGKVKWFNRQKGYGFIEGEDGKDYFVHFSAIEKGTFIRENDKVSFEPGEGDRGKNAQNVVLLQKGSEIAGNDESAEQASEEKEVAEQPLEE